jgi:hypothetical protein
MSLAGSRQNDRQKDIIFQAGAQDNCQEPALLAEFQSGDAASSPKIRHDTRFAECDDCVTIGLQICDNVAKYEREHRFCGHSIGAVLDFDGGHGGRLRSRCLAIAQAAPALKEAIAFSLLSVTT